MTRERVDHIAQGGSRDHLQPLACTPLATHHVVSRRSSFVQHSISSTGLRSAFGQHSINGACSFPQLVITLDCMHRSFDRHPLTATGPRSTFDNVHQQSIACLAQVKVMVWARSTVLPQPSRPTSAIRPCVCGDGSYMLKLQRGGAGRTRAG